MDIVYSSTANTLRTARQLLSNWVSLTALFEINASSAAQRTPFTSNPAILYIKEDRHFSWSIVNVFDSAGKKLYVIERASILANIWSVYDASSRIQIARIHAGVRNRSFDFFNKPGVQHREFLFNKGLSGRVFYLNDGPRYQWNRDTLYLERTINPGGKHEEVRERIGRARLLRRFRFDWEVLLDTTKIDQEVGIVTAFLSMISEWNLGLYTDTVGPTVTSKARKGSFEPKMQQVITAENQLSVDNPDNTENHFFLVLRNSDNGALSTPIEIPLDHHANPFPLASVKLLTSGSQWDVEPTHPTTYGHKESGRYIENSKYVQAHKNHDEQTSQQLEAEAKAVSYTPYSRAATEGPAKPVKYKKYGGYGSANLEGV